jgi:hypothetical protein
MGPSLVIVQRFEVGWEKLFKAQSKKEKKIKGLIIKKLVKM